MLQFGAGFEGDAGRQRSTAALASGKDLRDTKSSELGGVTNRPDDEVVRRIAPDNTDCRVSFVESILAVPQQVPQITDRGRQFS